MPLGGNMSLPLLSLVVGEDAYFIVDSKTISRFAGAVRRCFSYAPDRLYFRQQNGHLLGMGRDFSDYLGLVEFRI